MSFEEDLELAIRFNNLNYLKKWEIISTRVYTSKKGHKEHIVFKTKTYDLQNKLTQVPVFNNLI